MSVYLFPADELGAALIVLAPNAANRNVLADTLTLISKANAQQWNRRYPGAPARERARAVPAAQILAAAAALGTSTGPGSAPWWKGVRVIDDFYYNADTPLLADVLATAFDRVVCFLSSAQPGPAPEETPAAALAVDMARVAKAMPLFSADELGAALVVVAPYLRADTLTLISRANARQWNKRHPGAPARAKAVPAAQILAAAAALGTSAAPGSAPWWKGVRVINSLRDNADTTTRPALLLLADVLAASFERVVCYAKAAAPPAASAVDTVRAAQAVRDLAKLYADRADLHRRLEHAEHAKPDAAERITADLAAWHPGLGSLALLLAYEGEARKTLLSALTGDREQARFFDDLVARIMGRTDLLQALQRAMPYSFELP